MLHITSALKGCRLELTDGSLGKVDDLLFDDRTWKIRWLVVDTGSWLSGHKVLLHPSAIKEADPDERIVRLGLTKAQVEASPSIRSDQPVSRQYENDLYMYYGWDPRWDNALMVGGLGVPPMMPASNETMVRGEAALQSHLDEGDPHLRSILAVTGYHVRASDGGIGHIDNMLVDGVNWGIRYLIIDTRNWWPGKQVLLSPYAITDICWLDHEVRLDVTRDQVRTSPVWTPSDAVDQIYEQELHRHYGWPGYGW